MLSLKLYKFCWFFFVLYTTCLNYLTGTGMDERIESTIRLVGWTICICISLANDSSSILWQQIYNLMQLVYLPVKLRTFEATDYTVTEWLFAGSSHLNNNWKQWILKPININTRWNFGLKSASCWFDFLFIFSYFFFFAKLWLFKFRNLLFALFK